PGAGDEAQPSLPLAAPAPPGGDDRGGIVYMKQPLEREQVLPGFTYKVRWPDSDHAIYITLNDIMQDGRRRPFEIFINSKNMEHYAWTVALTRMISAVFRRGGDVSFVVEELKAIFDPQGGQWMNGRYVPSLLAAIGEVIEQHMVRIGFIVPEPVPDRPALKASVTDANAPTLPGGGKPATTRPAETAARPARHCPRCGHAAFVLEGGCWVCMDCGYTRCG